VTQFVYFVESADEWDVVQHDLRGQKQAIVVPLSERVRAITRSSGVQVTDLNDVVGLRTHLRIVAASHRIMQRVDLEVETGNLGLAGTGTLRNYFRVLLHYVLFLVDVVVSICAMFPKATLVAVERPFVPSGTGEVLIPEQAMLSHVVSAVGTALFRETKMLSSAGSVWKVHSWSANPPRFLLPILNRVLLLFWSRRDVVLVPSSAYGMKRLAAALKLAGLEVIQVREVGKRWWRSLAGAVWSLVSLLPGVEFNKKSALGVGGVWSVPVEGSAEGEKCRQMGERLLRAGFTFRRVPLADIMRDKVLCDIATAAARSEELRQYYQVALDLLRPVAIVSQGARWDNGLAIGEAGTKSGIPTMLISHGSHVAPRNSVETLEFSDHANGLLYSPSYQISIVQSPNAERALQRMAPTTSYVRTRPLMWGYQEVVRQNDPQKEPVILHAGTPKPRWGFRSWWYETTEEYISGIADLLMAVERLPRGRLVVRLRPSVECAVETMKCLLPTSSRLEVKTKGKFLDDLARADVLVSFSSTTLEEAVHAGCPVLQYGGGGRYQHLPGILWGDGPPRRSPVYSVKRSGDLSVALAWVLQEHRERPLRTEELVPYKYEESKALSINEFARCLSDPDRLLTPHVNAGHPDRGSRAIADVSGSP